MSGFNPLLFVNQEQKIRGFQKLLEPATPQAVMVIEAPRDMGKTWLVAYLQDRCQQPDVAAPAAFVDFRHPREIHEIQDVLGLIRLLRNKLNQPAFFHELNGTINSFTSNKQEGMAGRVMLRGMMERYFDPDDIAGLAFDLLIDFDNLPGGSRGNTKSGKIRALIEECEQQKRLAELVELCARQRPSVDWSPVHTAASPTTLPEMDEAVADQNGRLWADTEIERQRAERQINDAFFACLAQLMVAKKQVVFLFDSVEEAPDVAKNWLRHELLLRLRDGQINDAVVIITGRKTPDLTDLGIRHLLVQTSLAPFTEEHVREYFEERRKISGLDLRTVVLTSGGVPGALAMMADHAGTLVQEDDDFFKEL
jgi:hypothetical protein